MKVLLTVMLVLLTFSNGNSLSFSNQLPLGYLDRISNEGFAYGWALNPETANPIDVHFYLDGLAGSSGRFIGFFRANLPRPDVNNVTGYPGDHGFNFRIPNQYWDGAEHYLYAYAIDNEGGLNPHLLNSPQSFILSQPVNTGTNNNFSVEIVGTPEIVFDYSKDSCEDLDIPDAPTRVFRDRLGRINLLATHHQSYRMVGNSLDTLKKDCRKIMSSTENPDFNDFRFAEWIAATYTLDGQTIYSLIHNEWYAYLVDPKCKQSEQINGWLNGITTAVSHNGGASFSAPSCDHIVVRPTLNWNNSFGCEPSKPTIFGAFAPSNIFKKDNHYYAFFQSEKDPLGILDVGACLMRTSRLEKASDWEIWTQSGWDSTIDAICKPIDPMRIEKMHESITWNTYLQTYVLVGTKYSPSQGVYFSTSKDLFNWTDSVKFLPASAVYPVLIDPSSPTRNFETSGQEGYIYYTRFNQGFSLDRDLLRQKIRFVKK